MDLHRISTLVNQTIIQTGQFIKTQRGQVNAADVHDKSLNNLVSFVDRQAEQQLVKDLKNILPEAGFITEEETIAQSNHSLRWIIDPLDGTTNFLYNLPLYSVSVALADGDDLLVGAVYVPELNELFYATKGGGSFLNDHPISVSTESDISKTLAATGFPYFQFHNLDKYMAFFKKVMQSNRGIRRMGSAAIDMAYVACGRFDFYFEYDLNTWDIAAGILLIQEAGGTVTEFDGESGALSGKEILASNDLLHPQLVSWAR